MDLALVLELKNMIHVSTVHVKHRNGPEKSFLDLNQSLEFHLLQLMMVMSQPLMPSSITDTMSNSILSSRYFDAKARSNARVELTKSLRGALSAGRPTSDEWIDFLTTSWCSKTFVRLSNVPRSRLLKCKLNLMRVLLKPMPAPRLSPEHPEYQNAKREQQQKAFEMQDSSDPASQLQKWNKIPRSYECPSQFEEIDYRFYFQT